MHEGKKPFSLSRILRITFGIFMILVYLGMGALMLLNYFGIKQYIAVFLGVLFIVYGIFRGYRQFKGMDYTNR